MKTKVLILALVTALFLATVGVALANNGVELQRWALGSGASDSTAAGGEVTLHATLGQPVVGVVTGGDVTLGQGFWCSTTPGYNIYLPLVIRNYQP